MRYPALGSASATDLAGAPAARGAGPFPLVAWVQAGYVVAAPVFPLENANAPGGPNEADLVNQPADISFVISRLLDGSADPTTHPSGMIDPKRIAVAGHSDGGETALAVAYARGFRDPRVDAAAILLRGQDPRCRRIQRPRQKRGLLFLGCLTLESDGVYCCGSWCGHLTKRKAALLPVDRVAPELE